MKKTMFITSVIMVVVMAIALTTSSLAWFSAAGNNYVSTQTLQLKAVGTAATGIFIRHDSSDTWHDSIALTDDGTTGLKPMVPFTKVASSPSAANLLDALVGGVEGAYMSEADFILDYPKYADEEEATVATYAAIYAAYNTQAAIDGTPENTLGVLSADAAGYAHLVSLNYLSADAIGTTTAQQNRSAYMIGNEIDSNRDFVNKVNRTNYYTDTLEIKNGAEGYGAANIRLGVEINFKYNVQTRIGDTWDFGAEQKYTRANRGASQFDNDATLCVAVLAKVSEFDTDKNVFQGIHDENGDAWEIIAYADSKNYTTLVDTAYVWNNGSVNTYNVTCGLNSAKFEEGAASGNSTAGVSTETLWKLTTDELRGARDWTVDQNYNLDDDDDFEALAGDGVVLPADVKTIKVVAWYSSDLTNANSEYANLKFELKFTSYVYNGSAWVVAE